MGRSRTNSIAAFGVTYTHTCRRIFNSLTLPNMGVASSSSNLGGRAVFCLSFFRLHGSSRPPVALQHLSAYLSEAIKSADKTVSLLMSIPMLKTSTHLRFTHSFLNLDWIWALVVYGGKRCELGGLETLTIPLRLLPRRDKENT